MSDGFLTFYSMSAPLAWLTGWIASTGARLAKPGTDGLVALLDIEGDQHLVDRTRLDEALTAEDLDLTFETWFSGSEDMVVAARHLAARLYSVTCYLDGLDGPELEAVTRAATEHAVRYPSEVVALVVDRRGTTADVDWDAFVTDPGLVPAAPDLLIMKHDSLRPTVPVGDEWRRDDPAPGLLRFSGSA